MNMVDVPQIIEFYYDKKRYSFKVWRFETMPELHAALLKNDIREFAKNIAAYTDCRQNDDQAGAMYLLDKSIAALACQASTMALYLGDLAHIVDYDQDWREIVSNLTGRITAELYSKNRFF